LDTARMIACRGFSGTKLVNAIGEAFYGFSPLQARIMKIITPLGEGRIIKLTPEETETPVALLPSSITPSITSLRYRLAISPDPETQKRMALMELRLAEGQGYVPATDPTKRFREVLSFGKPPAKEAGYPSKALMQALLPDMASCICQGCTDMVDVPEEASAIRPEACYALPGPEESPTYLIKGDGGRWLAISEGLAEESVVERASEARSNGSRHEARLLSRHRVGSRIFPDIEADLFILSIQEGTDYDRLLRRAGLTYMDGPLDGAVPLERVLPDFSAGYLREEDGLMAGRANAGGKEYFIWSGAMESAFEGGMSASEYSDREDPSSKRKMRIAMKLISRAEQSGKLQVRLHDGRLIWLIPLRK